MRASQLAARFGERFQAFADERSEEKRRSNNFISPAPNFQTVFQNVKIGTEIKDNKMIDVFDAKFVLNFKVLHKVVFGNLIIFSSVMFFRITFFSFID